MSELNVLCGNDRLVPDITVAARNAEYRDGDLADPPLLCVGIFSPGQSFSTLLDKAQRLARAGNPVCWLIWPERRQAWTYTAETIREAAEILTASIAGAHSVHISLAEMWAELD